ncbi:MAG TPA: PRC-barrel domain-containing protein [Leptolyngbyaceae cyanobacterium]
MRKGTDILNRSIIAFNTGKKIATILDLIFDQETNQLLGFLVDEGGLFHSAKVVPLDRVRAIGPDVIVVSGQDAIVSVKAAPQIQTILEHKLVLKGNRIITTDGRYLGSIVDLYFNDQTGNIEGYETSGGLFADTYSGRAFIPAPQTVKIGKEVTFVPPETADLMAEQVGGIRGAMMAAGTRIQETTATAGQQLQDATLAANEQLQTATASANRTLQEVANGASDRFDQGSTNAATQLTNRLVASDEQCNYVVGKAVECDIQTPDGMILLVKNQVVTLSLAEEAQKLGILDRVYRATGGSLTVGINRQLRDATDQAESNLNRTAQWGSAALSNLAARAGIEHAKGRRVQRMVRSEAGTIIAAPGQIVTDTVVERATLSNREVALLDAVGLQPTEATRYRANDAVSNTGMRVREQAAIAQENAYTFWEELKTQYREFQERSTRAIHKQRIEQALGRPVSRVILDPHDRIILNVGELITHKAIQQAEQGGVLNILLNSVYKRKPEISDTELRAPEHGVASLEREPRLTSK